MKNIFRWTTKLVFLFTVFLTGQQTAYAQLYSGLHEFNNPEVPQRIIFKREPEMVHGTMQYVNNRYEQYAGKPLQKLLSPNPFVIGPSANSAKNPEGILNHGPAHAQNITAGYFPEAVWHSLSFRVKTNGFFKTDTNRHLAFIARAAFPQQNRDRKRDGMGVIFSQYLGHGNTGEIFNTLRDPSEEITPFGNPMCPKPGEPQQENCPPTDGQTYFVQIYATQNYMLYYIANESTQQLSGFREMSRTQGATTILGSGLAFALICIEGLDGPGCEVYADKSEFMVDIYDINSLWF